ncbi:MAG TPA: SPOR domain-containing protein [Acidiferrobacteraceae bacterium]|nr:SPOR domain-containing protein [Acidiferrobacteraceae bacterium]
MLFVGLALGWAAFYVYQHEPKPKPVARAPTIPQPEKHLPRRSRFDFYTMLPEFERVLPAHHEPRGRPVPQRPPRGDRYILQAGSFPDYRDADHLKARLALHGFEARIQKVSIQGRGLYYRLRLGPYPTLAAMNRAHLRLAHIGVHALRLEVHGLRQHRRP